MRASVAATPGPSSRSSTGSTSCRTRARVKRGSLLCGSVQKEMSSARQADSVSARVTPSSGRTKRSSKVRRIPDSERAPEPRASPSRTVSAWSSRVCPSSTGLAEKCSASWPRAAYLACRAPASTPAERASTVTRIEAVSSTPIDAIWPTTLVVCSVEPSCRPWSTVTPMTRAPTLCPSNTVAASSASESAPPEQATITVAPSATHGRTASRTAATAGSSDISRSAAQPWTRAIHSAGSRISCLVGRLAGSAQTALKPSMPTLSTAARTNTAPSRY